MMGRKLPHRPRHLGVSAGHHQPRRKSHGCKGVVHHGPPARHL